MASEGGSLIEPMPQIIPPKEFHATMPRLEPLRRNGVTCGYCHSKNVKERKSKPNFYRCNDCKKDFTIRVGTIFHRSHVPLHKWLYAMYLVMTSRKGISSMQLSKEIGVTYKSAWFLSQRIRAACGNMTDKLLSGIVEVDEAYFGGLE